MSNPAQAARVMLAELSKSLFCAVDDQFQVAWVLCIHAHTAGSEKPAERIAEYSPVFLAEDAYKETGLPDDDMAAAAEWCVSRGFTPRKSEQGVDRFRYRVDYAVIERALAARRAVMETSA